MDPPRPHSPVRVRTLLMRRISEMCVVLWGWALVRVLRVRRRLSRRVGGWRGCGFCRGRMGMGMGWRRRMGRRLGGRWEGMGLRLGVDDDVVQKMDFGLYFFFLSLFLSLSLSLSGPRAWIWWRLGVILSVCFSSLSSPRFSFSSSFSFSGASRILRRLRAIGSHQPLGTALSPSLFSLPFWAFLWIVHCTTHQKGSPSSSLRSELPSSSSQS